MRSYKSKGTPSPKGTALGVFDCLKRWSIRSAFICVALLAAVIGYRSLISSSFLKIQRIEINDLVRLDRRAILKLANIKPGQSLLGIDLGEIKQRVEAHPGVARAWVGRVFPDTVMIRVEEREVVGRILLDQGTYLLDSRGNLIPNFPPWDREPLIHLVGLKRADLQNRPEACKRVLLAALELIRHLDAHTNLAIREVTLDPTLGLRLAIMGGPSDIRLGFGELTGRLERLDGIIDHLRRKGRLEKALWIDLRYPSRAVVKFRG